MDGLDLLKAFREVAERGSFSRAATVLGISKATASKYVAQLEERFSVRLLNRSTRSVSLTDAGQLLLERSKPLMEMIELTQSELGAHASKPRGRLRVSAPHGLAQSKLSGILGEFISAYPEVHVSIHLSNRVIDLVEEGVDVAIRLGRIRDENLIVRRLHLMELALCATPGYWSRRGLPTKPDDMRRHDVLTYSHGNGAPHLPFEVDGEPYSVPVHSRMDANDASPLIGAALKGLGAVCVPAMMAQQHIERGALVPVLKEYMPRDLWLYAAYTQRRHNSAALRAMLDFLAQRFDTSPAPAAVGKAGPRAKPRSARKAAAPAE
ncbi:MAG: LysR family transcriptional regulator [Gammaproteobacteria bacterium]|nr:LysR family transcriptional regulator [Gammaproteobacteria bacterium]